MVAQPRRIEGGERLDRRQYSSHNVDSSIVAARASDTMRYRRCSHARATEGESGLARIALGANEPSTPIGECGGAHNWPAFAAIEMDDPVRTCVSM